MFLKPRLFICTLLTSVSSLFMSCQSPDVIKTEVVNNSDRSLRTPSWVLSSKDMALEGSDAIFIYRTTLDADNRPDTCLAIAKTQASSEMIKYIKNSITNSAQVDDSNGKNDPSYSSLIAVLSQGTLSGAQVSDTYWEQTLQTNKAGMLPIRQLMCAAKISIDKNLLEKQMHAAITGSKGANTTIKEKLIKAQQNFIDNISQINSSK